MIKHIVMWKLQDEALGKTKEENAKKIKADLENLVGKIKEIKKLYVGLNVNDDPTASDACLVSEFESMEDVKNYQVNPDHKKVSDFVKQVSISRSVVDFEF